MSAPDKFATMPAALEAFAAGRCKRWVRVDGHQVDLVQAAAEASRVREEPVRIEPAAPESIAAGIIHDLEVERSIAAELARASGVLPELAVPKVPAPAPVECCARCGRPMIGGAA